MDKESYNNAMGLESQGTEENIPLVTVNTGDSPNPPTTNVETQEDAERKIGFKDAYSICDIEFIDEFTSSKVPSYLAKGKKVLTVPSNDINPDNFTDSDCLKKIKDFIEMPKMVINVIGYLSSDYAPLRLREAMKCLIPMTTNTCIITEGYAKLFTDMVGRCVREIQENCNVIDNEECNVGIMSIGIGSWSRIIGIDRIERQENYNISELKSKHSKLADGEGVKINGETSFLLNKNNTHFIMVDVNAEGESRGSDLRKAITQNVQAPRANLVVGGGVKSLAGISEGLEKKVPSLLIEGSGGVADILARLLKQLENYTQPFSPEFIKRFVEHYYTPPDKINEYTYQPDPTEIQKCLLHHKYLLILDMSNFCKKDVQELLLNAYLETGKHESKDKLELCHSWNGMHHAIKALEKIGDDQDQILVECFIKFLKGGSTSFVDMMISHRPTVFNLLEKDHFLDLYKSDEIQCNLIKQFCDIEKEDIDGISKLAEQIECFCSYGEDNSDIPENILNQQVASFTCCEGENLTKNISKIDVKFHLFIWCLLYKFYDLALYFWKICDYPIANGLIASSFLRKTNRIRNADKESNEIRTKQACWYEDQASMLLSKCNDRSQIRTKFILLQHLAQRGEMSCFQIATKDYKNAKFLENPVASRHLDDLWGRCAENDWLTSIWRLVCSILIFIFLLSIVASCLTSHDIILKTSLPIGFVCLIISLYMADVQKTIFRRPYDLIKAFSKKEAVTDFKKLEKVSKNEARSCLKAGIFMDLFYDEANSKNDQSFLEQFSDFWTNRMMFLATPQIKFTLHNCTFLLHLMMFLYFILTAQLNFTKYAPSSTEGFLYIFWISYFCEEMKQLFRGDFTNLKCKFREYWASLWNKFDTAMYILLLIIIVSRYTIYCTENLRSSKYLFVSVLNLYTIYFVLWCFRTLQLFTVSRQLGPKLIMIRMMMQDLGRILLYVLIFTFSYAVWLKAMKRTILPSIISQDANVTVVYKFPLDYFWEQVENADVLDFLNDLFAHPVWHLFGESFIDDLDKYLPSNRTDPYRDRYKLNIIKLAIPFVRLAYVFITVVLLLNLMIAMFQYSITKAQSKADSLWNIYRKSVIFEYNYRRMLPPPISLLLDIWSLLWFIIRGCRNARNACKKKECKEKFVCSMLSFKVIEKIDLDETFAAANSAQRGDFEASEIKSVDWVDWIDFVCKWEKLIQNKLIKPIIPSFTHEKDFYSKSTNMIISNGESIASNN